MQWIGVSSRGKRRSCARRMSEATHVCWICMYLSRPVAGVVLLHQSDLRTLFRRTSAVALKPGVDLAPLHLVNRTRLLNSYRQPCAGTVAFALKPQLRNWAIHRHHSRFVAGERDEAAASGGHEGRCTARKKKRRNSLANRRTARYTWSCPRPRFHWWIPR
jgi:hypothetical protein